jgi:hypothetical protein
MLVSRKASGSSTSALSSRSYETPVAASIISAATMLSVSE